MNNLTLARVYMLFALLLLLMGWKICEGASEQITKSQAEHEAQVDRMLSSLE